MKKHPTTLVKGKTSLVVDIVFISKSANTLMELNVIPYVFFINHPKICCMYHGFCSEEVHIHWNYCVHD
uniref:Uncharacterized protein n=1 Tax=Lepeophtheirus salmonis TaxID=72036 RepID=A0A0K2V5K1_LEPSM